MIVLGISTLVQNPAAAILIDGKLIAFAEEERFIRIKSANGRFPTKAMHYCLQEANLSFGDIDTIAIGWDCTKYRFFMPLYAAWLRAKHHRSAGANVYDNALHELVRLRPDIVNRRIEFELRKTGYKGKIPPIQFISHHLSHAASVYFASGFGQAAVIVLDGSGEERATTLYKALGSNITEISHTNIPDSLGWFYAAMSSYLGFTPYQDDGFVMGLSSYGKPDAIIQEKIAQILSFSANGNYSVNPRYTLLGDHSWSEHFSDQLVSLLGSPRPSGYPMTRRHKNIAYAAQNQLEQVILTIVKNALKKTGLKHVCLAGGVALNCKANGVIATSGLVDHMFIQPASNDAGTALGAAMIVANEAGEDPRFYMQHARWGPSYSPSQIKNTLDEAGVNYSRPKKMNYTVAGAITRGKVVAFFQGRMEMGPRALGGRSILADATKRGINDYINQKIKHREPWRPFCPSIIKEVSNIYLVNPKEDRFMTIIYDVPKNKQGDIPSVVHVDGTTRPHVVDDSVDPSFYEIIKKVGENTGAPVVLNTSFNVKGEPIVCTPKDALRCYFSTGIDALAIDGFWLEKDTAPQ